MITLYIKTHNVTGLKYFGKTGSADPYKYHGSGKYWKRHIAVHGYDVTTEIIGQFEDLQECSRIALKFSEDHQIATSDLWANFKAENGLDGGFAHLNDGSEAHRTRCVRAGKRSQELHPEIKENLVPTTAATAALGTATKLNKYGTSYFSDIAKYEKTAEHRQKLAEQSRGNGAGKANKGLVRSKIECPHCGKLGANNVMSRFHLNNCKKRST
jgi:hypothetical protein